MLSKPEGSMKLNVTSASWLGEWLLAQQTLIPVITVTT